MNLFPVLYSMHDIHMLRNIKILGHPPWTTVHTVLPTIRLCSHTLCCRCSSICKTLSILVHFLALQKLHDVRSLYVLYSHKATHTMQYNNLEQSGDLASLTDRHSSVISMLNVSSVQQVNSSQHISRTRDSITKWMCGHSTIYDTCSHQHIPVCRCVSLSDTNLFLLHKQISVAAVSQFYLVWI